MFLYFLGQKWYFRSYFGDVIPYTTGQFSLDRPYDGWTSCSWVFGQKTLIMDEYENFWYNPLLLQPATQLFDTRINSALKLTVHYLFPDNLV